MRVIIRGFYFLFHCFLFPQPVSPPPAVPFFVLFLGCAFSWCLPRRALRAQVQFAWPPYPFRTSRKARASSLSAPLRSRLCSGGVDPSPFAGMSGLRNVKICLHKLILPLPAAPGSPIHRQQTGMLLCVCVCVNRPPGILLLSGGVSAQTPAAESGSLLAFLSS